jgi:hypothetical protein
LIAGEQMKTTKQIAKIVSIDHLNKNFEVKITNWQAAPEVGDNGSVLIPLPKSMFGEYFEVGDEIEFKKMDKPDFKIVNLSCEVLRLARFKRDLISILIRLNNDNHPQKRCVLLNEDGFVLLSAKKNPEKLILLQNKLDN